MCDSDTVAIASELLSIGTAYESRATRHSRHRYNTQMRFALFVSCALVACGSSPPLAKSDQPAVVAAPTEDVQAATRSPEQEPAAGNSAEGLRLEPAAIEIPNARAYKGYVLGGLPTRQQLDAAMEAGFESAMSLMASDEAGGPELARYGASQGLRYLRFTIASEEDLTESMAWQFAATISMLGKPAIIHCATGQRVAAIVALKAYFVEELAAEDAYAIGEALGMGEYAEHVRGLLEL